MDMWSDSLKSILGLHLGSSRHLDSSLGPSGNPYPTKSRGPIPPAGLSLAGRFLNLCFLWHRVTGTQDCQK